MTVTIPAPLTSDEQAALVAKAKAQGVSVNSLLRMAVLNIIAPAPDSKPPISVEEFDKALEEIADMIPPGIPSLSDESLRRENMYTREDEWNRE
jgi:hypothetical protein